MREALHHMALIAPISGEGDRAADLLAEAETHYKKMLRAFEALEEAGLANLSRTDAERLARDYRAATQTLFNERQHLERTLKKEAGVVHDYALDMAAARAEIGRQLDRIRAASGSGEVSR